ncbi:MULTISPECIES: hypothetical protein [unclassified Stenotrophomonas]|uniref:hypothetical protein n=1 Tax=unclassified Stenotrophomonas TaxID=196198 RepID=UPI00259BE8AA|nr:MULTISPECIES: hypothetical protein [unclassified Stenotrophomonas]WNB78781.1 hypothetical protein Q9R16_13235 [Stenotrophomonas sp. 9]
MNKPRYSLDIVIAAPGTPLLDPDSGKQQLTPDGTPDTSGPGHMFYVLHAPGKAAQSFGFAPVEHGSMNGPGRIVRDDVKVYKDPAHVRTIEITEAQYNKLKASATIQWRTASASTTPTCVTTAWTSPGTH